MDSPQIDRNTSRSICNAVGERLQRDLRPEASPLSPQLQHLMEELRRQDGEAPRRSCHYLGVLRHDANLRKRYFDHKRVAFGGGSGDNAACFQ